MQGVYDWVEARNRSERRRRVVVVGLVGILVSCVVIWASWPIPRPFEGNGHSIIVSMRGSTTSIEEQIIRAAVIARVRLISVSQGMESSDYGMYGAGLVARDSNTGEIEPFGSDLTLGGRFVPPKYGSVLVFTFEVLEYLKGSGGSQAVGVAKQQPMYDTPKEAVENSDRLCPRITTWIACRLNLLGTRDTQWDDKEAIVFLDDYRGGRQEERFLFGHHSFHGVDGYTTYSGIDKKWLPETTKQGHFQVGSRDGVSLDDLRVLVEDLEARLATDGSSLEYRTCVALEYQIARWRSDPQTLKPEPQDFEECGK